MGRRGENIRKRTDGRWEARAVCGPPMDGKTNYKYFYSSSYQGAKDRKKEFLLSLEAVPKPAQGFPESLPSTESAAKEAAPDTCINSPASAGNTSEDQKSPPLFSDVANAWLAAKRLSVKKSTYASYSFMVEKHLLPEFGNLAIKDVGTNRIDAFLLDKKAHGGIRGGEPLSEKTISEIKGTLNRVLRYAKSHNIIETVPESMPVSVKQTPIEILTKQEQESIEAEALSEDTHFSLGVLLCLNTGIREGELCCLQWGDFDWDAETLSINKTVYRIANKDGGTGPRTRVVVDRPKTLCSIRTIPLPSEIVPFLRERAGAASEYVVTGTRKFMEPRVCRDRYARFERRAGVAHHHFHNLRHTYATNCVEDGVNTKVLSENLGHSSVNITLQLYVHPSMGTKKAEVNKLKTFLNRGRNEKGSC
ncbi:MAG: site-specific integrase [Lachnospiraceae bacterium]|nr:site-specific integrase [Lachnospiraceae bacterium]